MNTQEVLDLAHDQIVEHGWCQSEIESEDGRLCILGAMTTLMMRDKIDWREFTDGMAELRRRSQAFAFRAPHLYNDAPNRQLHEVLTFLSAKWETLL